MDNGNLSNSRVQEQISLYLDNALDPDQTQEFLHQIEVDPSINSALEKERHFRSVIKSNLDRPKLEPDFVQFIKNNIH